MENTKLLIDIRPVTLKEANRLITELHRHHKPVRGHRFSISALVDGEVVGVCVVGRPVARGVDQWNVAEVTRLATNGGKNLCSALYSAAARACKAMGFEYIQTYTLENEPGTSLLASGWFLDGTTRGGDWNCSSRPDRRTDQPMVPKKRWRRDLNPRRDNVGS